MNKTIVLIYLSIVISLISISLISVQGTDGGGAPAPTPANTSGGGGGAPAPVPDNSTSGGGTANPMGIISGKILPVDSNATVYAVYFGAVGTIAGITTIDNNGEYSIQLPMGVYNLRIAAPGDYINRTIFQIISEGGNKVTKIQDITLAKIGETGSISGYVNPIIEGINVQIKKIGSSEFSGSSIVDSNGRYEITGLEPDTYRLLVYFNSALPSQNFSHYEWMMIDINANGSLSLNLTFTPKESEYAIDRIFIRFTDELSGTENKKREIIASYNCKIMSHYRNIYTINIPSDKTVNETIALFKSNSYIMVAEPMRRFYSGDVESEQDITQNENNNIPNTNPEEIKTTPPDKPSQDLSSINNISEVKIESKDIQNQNPPIENVPKRIQEKSLFERIILFLKSLFV